MKVFIKKLVEKFKKLVKKFPYIYRLCLKGRILKDFILSLTRIRRKGVLVYVGLHRGTSFNSIFRGYKKCYGFEANPEIFKSLQARYGKRANVYLFNVAVANYDGEIEFNISNNDGAASSIGHFNENWDNFKTGQVKFTKTIKVPCINLCHFLEKKGVNYIDDYISDIQGMDLEVLKTLKPLIHSKKIGSISCEVIKEGKSNIYRGLPDNKESAFHELLKDNYVLVAKGWGILKDGNFDKVPEDQWEMDFKWRLKN